MELSSYQHLFGPVHSMRLGLSLGVDVIPLKTCPLDCIYCEVGRTTHLTMARWEYVPADEVVREVMDAVTRSPQIDHITFSGSGEPTLNSSLGKMIRTIKQRTHIPVAVLTNGILFYQQQVRDDLLAADVVLPSLDAVSPQAFLKVNRPHPTVDLERVIEGLVKFRQQYCGKVWLEILFVKGVNDSAGEILLMKQTVARIKPDKIQVHTVRRLPAEPDAEPVSREFLEQACQMIGPPCEVISSAPRGSQVS